MIKEISLKNFKCFKKTNLCFSPITVLSGLNSCGKSTVYQALLLLIQSSDTTIEENESIIPILKLNGDYVQLGRPVEVLNTIKNKVIEIGYKTDQGNIEFQYKIEKNDSEKRKNDNSIFKLKKTKYKDNLRWYTYEDNGKRIKICAKRALNIEDSDFYECFINYMAKKIEATGVKKVTGDMVLSAIVEFENIENVIFFNSMLKSFTIRNEYINNCINEKYRDLFVYNEFREILINNNYTDDTITIEFQYLNRCLRQINISNHIRFIAPFRGYPKRVYIEIEDPNPLIKLKNISNNDIQYIEENNIIKTGKFIFAVNYWLKRIIKQSGNLAINSIVEGLVSENLIKDDKKVIAINNVGFGVSQLLPIIIDVLSSRDNDICIIDEPEVHLHPALQTRLAEFFYEMTKLDKTIIIETHSEYIINKLIYYKLRDQNDGIKLYWVVNKANSSTINKIEYDDLGYVINQPEGFLDENDKIVVDLNKERSKRI